MAKIIRATTLVLALSAYVQARIIQYDKNQPPPPPPPATTSATQEETESEASAQGTIQYDLTAAARQAALDVLQGLLTLY